MATPVKRVQLPQSLQAVEDLLLWDNVFKSAAVLGLATLLYVLLEWSGVPLLTWLSNVALFAVLGTVVWAFGARFMQQPGPAEHLPSVFKNGLDEAVVRMLAERARVFTNKGVAGLGRLLSGEDLVLSAKAFALLWVVGWVGRYITPVGMLFAAVLGLFTLPKLYEMRKDEIDDAFLKTQNAAQQHYMTAKVKTVQLINRLTPQKGPRPASSEISTPKSE